MLTDVLWLLTIEAEGEESPERKRLVDLVRRVFTGGVVPGSVLKERLDVYLMAKAAVIPSIKQFQQRAVRINTREQYVASHIAFQFTKIRFNCIPSCAVWCNKSSIFCERRARGILSLLQNLPALRYALCLLCKDR